ncbi:MAG: arylesterase [Burkholderiales bacterium]|nr:arylesterase [Burkholderiales bacterium]MCA3161148.1 arylesterase [Burkholderiales bacterium]MCA3164826.1 arylesterase [Burkholderiales bacterium]MCA3166857.1 arylesterase [Burkholderiales bacterium]MCA3170531.1 arylesterase [Burkholderiales bacterium]
MAFIGLGLWPHTATAVASRAPVVLVLGDSLSAEYGIKRGSGWVQLLSERLEQQKFRWQVVNASVSGETSSGGRSRLPALLQQHRPRIVIIELGANDGLRGLSLDATRQNLRTMIQAAQQSGARVLLVGMQLPPNFGISYTRDFADLFRQLAKERKTALVPFLLEGIAADLSYFQDDRIHPNEKAQVRLLDNVWGGLLPLLK